MVALSPPTLPPACRTPATRAGAGPRFRWVLAGLWAWAAVSSLAAGPTPSAPAELPWQSSWALFGKPKYAEHFTHYDYVNPDAPKRGVLYLSNPDQRTSFDKFNPYTIKGNAPAGVSMFMMETLGDMSADELQSVYGLLADRFQIARDLSFVNVHLHPLARFSNGDPVVAADVKYSFDALTGGHASPQFSDLLGGISGVRVLDAHTLHVDFKVRKPDTLLSLFISLPVFSHKWGLNPDGSHKDFDQLITEYPLTTGPYTIAKTDSGRRIEFVRNPNYWAKDLPVRKGFCNYDRVVYRYYEDGNIVLEAFRAGEFDITAEVSAGLWTRQYKGGAFDDGRIIKKQFNEGMIIGLQSYDFNMRRPLFQDPRVREALSYTYDFSEVDRRNYHLYQRLSSMFSNSDFAAEGRPNAGELALLTPYRDKLPPAVFGPAFVSPDFGPHSSKLRENLRRARDLLTQAGWKTDSEGVLRNGAGDAFEFEYLDGQGGSTSGLAAWQRNLKKLGIQLNIREVDYALYNKRLETFDFDVMTYAQAAIALPQASVLKQMFGSEAAATVGSLNYAGTKDPVVDALITKIDEASTYEAMRDAARALDRVVMHNHYVLPDLSGSFELVAYRDKFGIPAQWPKYYGALYPPDTSIVIAWPVMTWWIKDANAQGTH